MLMDVKTAPILNQNLACLSNGVNGPYVLIKMKNVCMRSRYSQVSIKQCLQSEFLS